MSTILVTGATGNIGAEVIKYLSAVNTSHKIIAGVRNIEKAKKVFKDYSWLQFVTFDFEDQGTFNEALTGVDRIFLLRPPHISDVDKYFRPLIEAAERKGIKEIVFLSVQGADKSSVIPHNKIERLIVNEGLDYVFIRPSYFMQNLTTTLLSDIRRNRQVILPAGNAKFNWIDIENIGEACAVLLDKFEEYKNGAYDLTGLENATFEFVTSLINQSVRKPITFRNVNPLRFYSIKKRDGLATGMILVMIMLHFLPRFQKEPVISDFYEKLTGKKPNDLKAFIERERAVFE